MPDETRDNQFVVGRTEKQMGLDYYGEAHTGYDVNNVYNDPKLRNQNKVEYPRTKQPPFVLGPKVEPPNMPPGGRIQPGDHTRRPIDVIKNEKYPLSTADYFVHNRSDHFIRDVNQRIEGEDQSTYVNPKGAVEKIGYPNGSTEPTTVTVFSAATTNVNPHNDQTKAEIMKNGGLSGYLEEQGRKKELGTFNRPPLSPIHPFTRLNSKDNPHTADEALFKTYNRTKLPIADIEWRKGFRHIFITRPECYLMYDKNGLCDQALYDEDFSSAATRMPHIIRLLSPWYISGSFTDDILDTNWNFLLSNRVQGLSVTATTMSINENISKSIEGYTVTPAMHVDSRQGSTIDLSFRDTKTLEVFESARLWMLYMYKRKKGIFIPPYNGYAQHNNFLEHIPESGKPLDGIQYTRLHPYDRALEYCASLYDIITNESGTKILYWCKYYGIYPTSVTPNLTNESNGPITDMTTTITFKYHYRLENTNKVLVEFNHDAGLTNDIGEIKVDKIVNSLPFLLRNQYDNPVMPKYIGASGMFTGSPYIVMARSQPDPLDKSTTIVVPNLRFTNLKDIDLDGRINLGITNDRIDQHTKNVIAYE